MAVGDPIIVFQAGATDLVYRPAAGVTIMITSAGGGNGAANESVDQIFSIRQVGTSNRVHFYGFSSPSAGTWKNNPRDFNNMKVLADNNNEVFMFSAVSKEFAGIQIQ